jgi:flagellar basal-body rod protein FlgB
MNSSGILVFDLAAQRLAWTERRQGLLARNIANAATPGFRPTDLNPFSQRLTRALAAEPIRTQAHHLEGTRDSLLQSSRSNSVVQAPDGNAVTLDEQLTKVADTETMQALTTSIYKRYMGMFKVALDRS